MYVLNTALWRNYVSLMINVGKYRQLHWKIKFHWECNTQREELPNNTNQQTWRCKPSEEVRALRLPGRRKSQCQFAQEGHPGEGGICARPCPTRTELYRLRQKEKVVQGQHCRDRKAREQASGSFRKHFLSPYSEPGPGLGIVWGKDPSLAEPIVRLERQTQMGLLL